MVVPKGWKVIQYLESEYLTVWKVARKIRESKQIGYFKIPHQESYKYIGPLLANELVCNRLAHVIGLPITKTSVTTINGRTGVLSLAKSNCKLMNWSQLAKQHKNPLEVIVKPGRLYKTLVFDVWICNVDRSGKNIVVYPRGKKYDFYLIDHELTLLGAVRYENKPWQSPYWENVLKYTRGYHPALTRYGKNHRLLAPYIQEIRQIRPQTIHSIINRIPPQLLSKTDKMLIKRILLRRKHRLTQMMSHV